MQSAFLRLPEDSICDPRYGNSLTDSIYSSPTHSSSLVTSLPTAMTFISGMLRVSPKPLTTSIYSVVISSAPLFVVVRRAASSANWHSLTSSAFLVYHLNNFLYIPQSVSSKLLTLACHPSITKHEYRLKRNGVME